MWEKILEYGKRLASLMQSMDKAQEDIAGLKLEVKGLSRQIQSLTYQAQRDRENAAHERDKLLLRLELALVKNQLQLPPAGATGEKREIE